MERTNQTLKMEHLALGPLDGRYAQIGRKLAPYFSEYALVKNRVKVEVYWLELLVMELKLFDLVKKGEITKITKIYWDFSAEDFNQVKSIEAVINHDVKAVELFVANKLKENGLESLVSFVHIGCTSEDITNIAYARMIADAVQDVWLPAAEDLLECIERIAEKHADTPMLAHTHGQPATPTTVGKEFAVYLYRMKDVIEQLEDIKMKGKFNGATGNYSAISMAFPGSDWMALAEIFVTGLKLSFNPVTTQIESHDYMCQLADTIRHFNNILLDLNVDMWLYISKGYFKQIPTETEVGSSTMPHKVNPIRFENSEANIDMSNAIFMALSNKLPRSRMQRDLSDSSAQRNIGLAFGYSLQAIEQTTAGLKKVAVDEKVISEDLDDKWEVLAEPIQTMLRKYGIPDAYDKLKEMTRGKVVTKSDIQEFIKTLDVLSERDKTRLLELTPATYVGMAKRIVEHMLLRYRIAKGEIEVF